MKLLFSVNHPAIDEALTRFVELYEMTYPHQILAYYLLGSHTDDSALATSDIDLELIIQTGSMPSLALWSQRYPDTLVSFDVTTCEESALRQGVTPTLKVGGKLLYGTDICQHYPLLSLAQWTHDRMHAAYWLMNAIYARPKPVLLSAPYPNPTEEFWGYVNRLVLLPDGRQVPSTRNLMRTVGWMATALLAWKAGLYVARKRDCVRLYRVRGDDPNGAILLEDLFGVWRGQWNYLIPEQPEARRQLRELCMRVREWEEAFLLQYRTYLLDELADGQPDFIRHALWVQGQWPLADTQVQEYLEAAARRLE
jgi:hypothetical protein